MFDAISLFGAFTVVETVNRTHQIAGDTADALKTDTFAHLPLAGMCSAYMSSSSATFCR